MKIKGQTKCQRPVFKSDTKESLGKLLNYFDTGIEEVRTEKRPIEEVLTFLPEDIKNDIIPSLTLVRL